MTFDEIFKSSFLENLTAVSLTDSILALFSAFALGMFIYNVYKKTFQGVMYSEPFNLSLLLLTLLTTFIILAVTSNVVLSLGMVGALSIVRFRTAIKDPLDLVFLFWAIGGGIVLGAGLIPLALIGSALIGTILLFKGKGNSGIHPYLVILSISDPTIEEKAVAIMNERSTKIRLKSKTRNQNEIELIYETQLIQNDSSFINDIAKLSGVDNVQLVSFNGDYAA
ncbi:MAG: DUF4956 domain-containing protein [Erysipelotrichaceae bacterium]